MTLEIELKAHCDDHQALADKLLDLGALFVETSEQRDLYFNHPSRDFKSTDEALRVRQIGQSHILTYKGPKLGGPAKSREELEVAVENQEELKLILLKLGFRESGKVLKVRDLYIWKEIRICLDRVDGLGNFIELEKIGTASKSIEKELLALAEDLGLTRFEQRSYLELLTDSI